MAAVCCCCSYLRLLFVINLLSSGDILLVSERATKDVLSKSCSSQYSLESFAIFSGKYRLCWSLFYNKLAGLRTEILLKRGSYPEFFLRILQNVCSFFEVVFIRMLSCEWISLSILALGFFSLDRNQGVISLHFSSNSYSKKQKHYNKLFSFNILSFCKILWSCQLSSYQFYQYFNFTSY